MAARDRESEEAAENLPWPLQMEQQVNPLERDHDLAVVLPGGLEKNATVHGRWELRLMCLVFSNIYINSLFLNLRVYCQYLIISSLYFLINLQLYARRPWWISQLKHVLLPFCLLHAANQ